MDLQTANAALRENFAEWVLALYPRVTAIDADGSATLEMPITPALARIGGIVSGQALSALADTAMVFACAGKLGAFRPVATTNLDLQFLRPGTGARIEARAEVVRAGRSLIFTRAELVALPANKSVATATATFANPG
ncbi:PaaI family thioesterase [Pseudaestuariivita atlantica]|uniref:Thioesterase n=1 Tax=Pseudaestuariivita atlantica TaxID=1317121 RepID=A0A0L1JLZ8_9RHOB|nr:PaaI family thioesterase [Pseudaestuariivita atlantica]KNG92747.1 thioesterase [Pseudaestuariivita atlantica]